jgi:chromosome segregation ATPase
MSDELRTELALLRGTVHAGFARMDRYFELQQEQHVELRGQVQELRADVQELRADVQELRADVQELRAQLEALARRVDAIEVRLTSLEHEVRSLRDWTTREFADVRLELRRLRQDVVGRDESLRDEVETLTQRVARLERDWPEGRA